MVWLRNCEIGDAREFMKIKMFGCCKTSFVIKGSLIMKALDFMEM
jgi:hypothetical protein